MAGREIDGNGVIISFHYFSFQLFVRVRPFLTFHQVDYCSVCFHSDTDADGCIANIQLREFIWQRFITRSPRVGDQTINPCSV